MNNKQIFRILLFPAFGILLLAIPLLRDFHFESAMLAAIIGCFWAAIRAAGSSSKDDLIPTLRILGCVYLIGVPPFLFSLFSGCLTFGGFAFWMFTPLPSVFFGTAIGRISRILKFPSPKLLTVLILLFCAIGILLIEFFNFPQVYFYNHVWGIWPGPIYDEAVPFTGSYLFFRWITFLWGLLLWMIPTWSRNFQSQIITALSVIALIFSYLYLDEMRIVSPAQTIQEQLGGHHQTTHFELYFDEDFYSEEEVQYWALKHEFYLDQIINQLEIDWPEEEKIQSYLYAHAWQKKKITGAKFTSYVPIWLNDAQLHIAKQQLHGVLKHEMVHAVSRQFGNRLFNGSLSIGLIEGLAEGIAKDASAQSSLHQIVAAEKPFPDAKQMRSALSVAGFYGSAGSVSYTTTGSFVEFLLATYPAEFFKKAYASGDLEKSFGRSFEELISEWHQILNETQVDSVDRRISEFIFAQRSLFQKECPHKITRQMQLWDEYQKQLAEKDSAKAYEKLDKLFTLFPENDLVFAEWARSKLRQEHSNEIVTHFSDSDTLLTLHILHADGLFMQDGFTAANAYLQSISNKIEASDAPNFRYSLPIRKDSLHWSNLLDTRYVSKLPELTTFQKLNSPTRLIVLQQAIKQHSKTHIIDFARILFEDDINPDFFDVYEELLDQIIFLHEFEPARNWVQKISEEKLRLRYNERVSELKEWLQFVKDNSI